MQRRWWSELLLLALVACLARWTRIAHHGLLESPDRPWQGYDPDGHYHMRRVLRALRAEAEGSSTLVASRDPYLAYPVQRELGGAPIPWPPYYDALLARAARLELGRAALAPEHEGALVARVEELVGRWSMRCSIASCVLLAWLTTRLAGRAAGAIAGLWLALCFPCVRYGAPGNGDHHAFVSLMAIAFASMLSLELRRQRSEPSDELSPGATTITLAGLALAGWALLDARVSSPALALLLLASCGPTLLLARRRGRGHGCERRGSPRGALVAGILAGSLVGSWTAALLHLGAACGAAWIAFALRTPEQRPRLARWMAVCCGTAAVVLLPSLRGSGWLRSAPFSLVMPSAAQPLLLALVASAWLPWARPSGRLLRSAPWLALALLLLVPGAPLHAAWLEGLRWVLARGSFMSSVNESRPLTDAAELARFLGLGSLLLPGALWLHSRVVLRERRLELVPWIVALLVLLPLALLQRRFAEAAQAPLAVVLASAGADLLRPMGSRPPALLARAAIALLFVLGSHSRVVARAWRDPGNAMGLASEERRSQRAERQSFEWLAARTPEPASPPEYSVLARWELGHSLVWIGARPAVAGNFGSYTGEEGFLAPARFFLERDEQAGERLLERFGVRYVLVDGRLPSDLGNWVATLHPGEEEDWLGLEDGRAHWLESLGARMLACGGGAVPSLVDEGLGSLRLVHLSLVHDEGPSALGAGGVEPAGRIYEHVPGARVEAVGRAGERFVLLLSVRYPGLERDLLWRCSTTADAAGLARVRVPYCTDRANGDGWARGAARWSLGTRSGELVIPEEAVLAGRALPIDERR